NAWESQNGLYAKQKITNPKTNWIVGYSAESILRLMAQDKLANGLAIKFFVHRPSEPNDWGQNKTISEGRNLSFLASKEGEFRLWFQEGDKEPFEFIFENEGDYVIWGPGLRHWWAVGGKESTIVTVRWNPVTVVSAGVVADSAIQPFPATGKTGR